MPVIAKRTCTIYPTTISISQLSANQFSLGIYGDAASEIDDLLPSVRDHGILVPLVVIPVPAGFEVISGHRRLACARLLDFNEVPCQVRELNDSDAVRQAILHYNRQRCKTFSQSMREADAIEELWTAEANTRRVRNLRSVHRIKRALTITDRRNSDTLPLSEEILGPVPDQDQKQGSKVGRSDSALGRLLNLGGKDLYRQARTIWRLALAGDVRAQSGVKQLDSKTKTIHAVHKDLRRRDRFTVNFRPTPYDVWAFRHDRAFGIPHPGAIPPGIIAHTLYYFTPPDGLVVDPMAGGGTTIDVCEAMCRRFLSYDLKPTRSDISSHDIQYGFPAETKGCDLIFCDPPYHTMLAKHYAPESVATASLTEWITFLHKLAHHAFDVLRPGGYFALLLAAQTEKDLPAGFGYLDHAFCGYMAGLRAGFLPERRISCPMDGAYLPQHVRRARTDGRLLGQVRDLLVMRKGEKARENVGTAILHMQEPIPQK